MYDDDDGDEDRNDDVDDDEEDDGNDDGNNDADDDEAVGSALAPVCPTEGNRRARGARPGGRRRAVGTEENVSRIPPLPTTSPAPSNANTSAPRFTYTT